MQLPVQITFRGVSRSDAFERYVREHADKLDALAARVTGCHVALEAPHHRAHHGEHYRVRIDLIVPGAEVVATRSPDESRPYEDLYATIDAAFDDAGRRLQDVVRRQRGDTKPHERARHGKVVKLFAHEGYGFLKTSEGDELYFHRNSVLDGAFGRLSVGHRVRFVEDDSAGSPHASTVALG
jgi:cold shock CspA family protein